MPHTYINIILLTTAMPKINLDEKCKELEGKPWFPIDVASLNSQVVRLALFDGEFHWHRHENQDELFFIYKGAITLQFKDREDVTLNQGEIAVVPKGVEHCPKSIGPSYVLMFEPLALESKRN